MNYQHLTVVSEVWRSGRVESVHLGAAAVADASGVVVAHAGDPELCSYLRSAAKPLQLLVMLRLGLERVAPLREAEVAVCAASHGGETAHVAAVRCLLQRAGLTEAHLRCGAAPPLDPEAAQELLRGGHQPGVLHNNCSGKHAAMLLTCLANGWSLASYPDADHPLQRELVAHVESWAGVEAGVGVDGCGVPTFYLPLRAAARMTAALMEEAQAGGPAGRIVRAMTSHPWYTSGSQRLPYHLMRVVPELLAKEGAEGFFVVGIPAARSPWGRPVGLALKVADGGGEDVRGREPAVLAALTSLDALTTAELEQLRGYSAPTTFNSPGEAVGGVRGTVQLRRLAGG